MTLQISTDWNGTYTVCEDSITRYNLKGRQVSPGLLVKEHYTQVQEILHLLTLLERGKCYESMEPYWHDEAEYEGVLHLSEILTKLDEQFALLKLPEKYQSGLYEIEYLMKTLREGRYYENKIHHHPGIPRIETLGKRLMDASIDMIWRMDNKSPSKQEDIAESYRKHR